MNENGTVERRAVLYLAACSLSQTARDVFACVCYTPAGEVSRLDRRQAFDWTVASRRSGRTLGARCSAIPYAPSHFVSQCTHAASCCLLRITYSFLQTITIMKLVDRIAQHDPKKLFYTFEFFPPKTDQVKALYES